MFKEIETKRLLLRKLTLDDAEDLFEYASDEEVAKYVSWNPLENIDQAIRYIESVNKQYENSDNPYTWAIEYKEDGKMIGTIEMYTLSMKNKWCELESDLNRHYWNKGINTEALNAIIDFCFTDLNLNKVSARCYKQNIGSYKVLEKAGMVYEGVERQHLLKNGVFHDLLRFSILKKDYKAIKTIKGLNRHR